VKLALPTRMLTCGAHVFINGETVSCTGATAQAVRELADTRRLQLRTPARPGLRALLYEWYRAGYIELNNSVIA
jgi:hypothetical protein